MSSAEANAVREGGQARGSAGRKGLRVLVTGFPIYVARKLVQELVAGGDQVWMLARQQFSQQAEAFADKTNAELGAEGGRVEVLQGDILDIDLGLTGEQVRRLHAEVAEVHHIAGIRYLGVETRKMRLVNVEGLREVLEVCLGMKRLRRLCHWSTAFVAGNRSGVVFEHELMEGQRFRNAFEKSKADAEVLARASMKKLPITIVRPSILVGDSETGEVDRFDGPYLLVNAIVNAPANTAVPLPGKGRFPLPVVPADFVVRAARHLARHPAAVGGTYHLVDGQPLTARDFFHAVADAAGQPRPTVLLPGGVARTLLNMPLVRDLARQERTFVEWFDTDLRFDDRGARALLEESGITCPSVPSYVDVLVRYVREFTR